MVNQHNKGCEHHVSVSHGITALHLFFFARSQALESCCIDGTTPTTQASDPSTSPQIDAAWREKEHLDKANAYYREQQIADEIQQAWIERDMLEDGYSTEEVEAMKDEFWKPQDDLYSNDDSFTDDDRMDATYSVIDVESGLGKPLLHTKNPPGQFSSRPRGF